MNCTLSYLKKTLLYKKDLKLLSIIQLIMVLGLSLQWQAAKAQDPQFSQYYAAPMFLNPALVGLNQRGQIGINYRNQWPNIDANFETYSFYAGYNWEDLYSSAGIILNTDREGIAGLQSTNIGLQYAYQVGLNYKWTFRPGVEASYYFRDINFDQLTFGDQFDQNGLVRPVSSEVFNTGLNARFFDLSFGGILFSDKIWLGSALHHVTEPNQSISGGDSPLPKKFSLHGGYKILFSEMSARASSPEKGKERSMTPSFNYKQQGDFKQLDLGLYFTLEPILIGTWYRGLPIGGLENTKNAESVIFMLGVTKNDVTIGYSFDYTISDLGIGSGGAHEISISYAFSLADPRKPPKNVRELRCPVPFIF
ncbi:MAG: type IX secretion system membrane protein PorP/SprF [Cyclobacteriaceae bacterium]